MSHAYRVDALAVWAHNPAHARMHERSRERAHPGPLRLPQARGRLPRAEAGDPQIPAARPAYAISTSSHDEQQSRGERVSTERIECSRWLPCPQSQRVLPVLLSRSSLEADTS